MVTTSTQPETAGTVLPKEHTTSESTSSTDELAYVGIGRRAVALILDSIVLFTAFWAIGYVIGVLTGGLVAGGFDLTGAPALVAMVAWFAIGFGYFIVLEARSGQTLGKRLTGLRVVNEDGTPITMSSSIVRNGLRIIDGLMVYAVGAVSIAISGKNQRLGDHVANTVVVRSK